MILSDATVVAAIIGAGALLFGSILTIAGGFFAIYLSQKVTGEEEKKKLTREKIEETYRLTIHIRKWFIKSLFKAYQFVGLELLKTKLLTKVNSEDIDIEIDEPIERFETLINLYLNPVEKTFQKYRFLIQVMQHVMNIIAAQDTHKRPHAEIEGYLCGFLLSSFNLPDPLENEKDMDDKAFITAQKQVKEQVISIFRILEKEFDTSHGELQSLLQKELEKIL